MHATVGQVLINSALPSHLRDYSRVLDKKGVKDLTEQLAQENDPELYRKVIHALHNVGSSAAQSSGASFSIYDLRTPPKTKVAVERLRQRINGVYDNDQLSDSQKETVIVDLVMSEAPKIDKLMYAEALAAENPFALMVHSGSRGGIGDLRSLLVGDLLVKDHRDRPIAMPIIHGYSSGIRPEEYWAGAYGARKGVISTKLATQRAGFLGKQLVQAAHQQVVTEHDCGTDRGIPVAGDDPDNVGAVMAATKDAVDRGTVIDPRIIRQFKGKTILVRSPLTCEARHGICAKCAGIRERGDFPEIGDNLGVAAAQSLTERLSQGSLNVKHGGGRIESHKRQAIEGFDLINQLVQVPKAFREAAAVARMDGVVQSVDNVPQGGKLITVGNAEHYVPEGFDALVKPGDRVDAGDVISEGIPNPLELVRHRGIGAGRLDFVDIFRKAYQDNGLSANRRNIELMTRGLVNHVKVTDLDGIDDALPDDVVEYTNLERKYRPRYGSKRGAPTNAVGRYLERPALHYTIGTRVTRRVADNLKQQGIKEVVYHDDGPPFQPQMVRAMESLAASPDWQIRLGGSFLQKGLLEALHRGRGSEISGVSYIPGLARGKGFGERLETEGVY